MEREELAAWLRLLLTPGVGSATARRLLAAFGLPQQLFAQSREALSHIATPGQTQSLLLEPVDLPAQLELTWDWLQSGDDPEVQRRVLTLADRHYPRSLLTLEDPPLLLYVMGSARCLGALGEEAGLTPRLAIVGSRNPTPQGLGNARQFAAACANMGITVVSGLAMGVDGAAHEGALGASARNCVHCPTIAVVGTGLDRVYPQKHLALARRIAQQGLLISEYALATPPLSANFPKRNRIISGLSAGALVVEAALESGSLITARLASEQGKEVFAIPGSIHSPQSRGCHALIRQGAKLVESAQDIFEELKLSGSDRPSVPATLTKPANQEVDSPLLTAMGHDPVTLDALVARLGIDAASAQVRLLELELSGQVARLPGGLYQRLAQV